MRKRNSVAAAGLGFLLTCAIPWLLPIRGGELVITNSILSVFLWILLSLLMKRVLDHEFKGGAGAFLVPGILSALFSLCMGIGAQLEQRQSVDFGQFGLWAGVLILAGNGTLLVRFAWDRILERQKAGAAAAKPAGAEGDNARGREKRAFLLTAALIFVCYLPVFLAVYPGFFVYDAQDELMQVVTRSFTTHHPLVHVLLLGGIIQLVHKISGSYNLGIACYTLFQMAVMSCIYAWGIGRLKKEGAGRGFALLSALYFGLWPVLVMFSLCSAKDGLFTAMLFMVVILLRGLLGAPERFFHRKGDVVLFAGSCLLMMLLRHNGFYAFAVFAVLVCAFDREAEFVRFRKRILILFAGTIAGYFLISQALALALHADASENQEMLTVPIQQMARVYQMERDSLTDGERAALCEILPAQALERYTPKVSDGVKVDFDNEAYGRDPGKYRKLWLQIGLRHPIAYLNAWFMTSYGFWYPDTVIDVYRGNSVFTFTYADSSYFGYEVEQPGVRRSLLPFLDEAYRRMSLEITQQRIPVLSMLFSPGFLFWAHLFVLGFFWYAGRIRKLAPFALSLLVWLTVILGPTYLVRYVVFLWALLPVLLHDIGCGSANAHGG